MALDPWDRDPCTVDLDRGPWRLDRGGAWTVAVEVWSLEAVER